MLGRAVIRDLPEGQPLDGLTNARVVTRVPMPLQDQVWTVVEGDDFPAWERGFEPMSFATLGALVWNVQHRQGHIVAHRYLVDGRRIADAAAHLWGMRSLCETVNCDWAYRGHTLTEYAAELDRLAQWPINVGVYAG